MLANNWISDKEGLYRSASMTGALEANMLCVLILAVGSCQYNRLAKAVFRSPR